jgi:hypothetical protein
MPRGISAIAELIEAEPVDALIWPVYNYYWPGYVDRNLANCLTLPTTTRGRTQTVDSRKILRDVSNFQRHVHWLPSIYWGMVSTAAIDRARNDRGVFLNSITPDIYAGVAVAAVIDRHLRIDAPLTLSGESRHSNGAHQISGIGDLWEDSPSRKFVSENEESFHPDLVYAANIAVLTGETMLQARDHVSADLPRLDVATMLAAAMRHPDHLFNPLVRESSEGAMLQIAKAYRLEDWFAGELRTARTRSTTRFAREAIANLLRGAPLHACPADVDNIYAATLYADRISRPIASRSATTVRDVVGRFAKLRRGFMSALTRRAAAQ